MTQTHKKIEADGFILSYSMLESLVQLRLATKKEWRIFNNFNKNKND